MAILYQVSVRLVTLLKFISASVQVSNILVLTLFLAHFVFQMQHGRILCIDEFLKTSHNSRKVFSQIYMLSEGDFWDFGFTLFKTLHMKCNFILYYFKLTWSKPTLYFHYLLLKWLPVTQFTPLTLFPFMCFGFCKHYNLACFLLIILKNICQTTGYVTCFYAIHLYFTLWICCIYDINQARNSCS